jgi:hypothetical protein
MSTQTLQPFTWLIRKWTRPRIVAGKSLFSRTAFRVISGAMASGSSIAGFVMRDFIGASPADEISNFTRMTDREEKM